MLNKTLLSLIAVFSISLLTSGCSTWLGEDEGPGLPGERISILTLEESLEPDDVALSAEGFIVSEAWDNQFWPQAGGYPNHAMQHLALTTQQPKKLWSVNIGRGSQSDNPLLTQPILVDGIIYTMDTNKTVTAFDAEDGERIWKHDLRKGNDETLKGGGLAFGGSYLYATTGGTKVTALGPKTGEVFWTTQISSPLRAAPTAFEDHVYVSTLDNRVIALDSETGNTIWSHQGLQEDAGFLGAPSPAANGKIVVPAFSSGEVFALRRENGSVAWSD